MPVESVVLLSSVDSVVLSLLAFFDCLLVFFDCSLGLTLVDTEGLHVHVLV
jgi:hypothetical protein